MTLSCWGDQYGRLDTVNIKICPDQTGVYIGETSRTLYIRAKQHINDFIRADKVSLNGQELSSWMWEHQRASHPNIDKEIDPIRDYSFNILSNHRDALTRQLEEAVRINNGLDYNRHTDKTGNQITIRCLNRKDETFAPQVRWERERNPFL